MFTPETIYTHGSCLTEHKSFDGAANCARKSPRHPVITETFHFDRNPPSKAPRDEHSESLLHCGEETR